MLKKIERLIDIILAVLPEASDARLRRQVVHSLVMFGWSKFDSGAQPPPLQYLKDGALIRAARDEKPTPEEQRWDTIRTGYEFMYLDDFDLALASYVESGVLNEEEIRLEAEKQEARLKQQDQTNSFGDAFRLLHDSFAENQEEVCDAIVKGFRENINVLSLRELSQIVEIFDRIGESEFAEGVINYAEKNAPSPFWLQEDPFNRPLHGERLKAIVARRQVEAAPQPDFETDLIAAAQTYNADTIARVAAYSSNDFLRLLDSKSGPDLRKLVLSALEFRKIANATPEMLTIVRKAEEALAIIGRRSALNAFRVRNYGVSISGERANNAD